MLRLEQLDAHAGALPARALDHLADLELLELRHDRVGAVHVQPEQVLDPIVGVRARAARSHLD